MGGWWALLACTGPQSALDPAARDARVMAELTTWLGVGSIVLWFVVLVIFWRTLGPPPDEPLRAQRVLVVLGGGVIPSILLVVVLSLGLPPLPRVLANGPVEPVRITVSGEQYWWRIRYELPDGAFELANEIVLPVGRRTPLLLVSPDVIHSLWIPPLHGKMDLVPGRVNRLSLEPTEEGTWRGPCAEYCGLSHAIMTVFAVGVSEERFREWVAHQLEPAVEPADPVAAEGARVFLASGCGACHTVRGTPADGTLGPDLTHVGSRQSVGAGAVTNDPEGFRRWLAHTEALKPGVEMPSYGMLADAELDALAVYLESLR